MSGAFQTPRCIFENPIWQNVVEFRLFFLIYGKAIFKEEGYKQGAIKLERGQWLRSYRGLQADLEYVENRSVKKYSLSRIKRAVDSLVKAERIKVEDTELGTLFTVLNYSKYQGFENYRQHNENAERTERERRENGNTRSDRSTGDDRGRGLMLAVGVSGQKGGCRRARKMGVRHPAVVWTSQRLDTLIVEWQRGG